MHIASLDHLVLTVVDIDATIGFYRDVLGMQSTTFGRDRQALVFGHQKINLHSVAAPYEPKAERPIPGSADLCFLTDTPLAEVMEELAAHGIGLVEGPVDRTGAQGPIRSVYVRDPDANLVEISNLKTPRRD